MLVAALILAILAAAFFAFDFFKSAWTTFTSLGLALFASGFACFILDILHSQGKI
jgi:uncharacterized membrane protein HdeD (DUF308 family)